jgi:hypothetical protein
MLYAVLCYNSQEVVGSWSKEQDDATMVRLAAVEEKLAAQGRLGPVARLMPTTTAKTLRKGSEMLILDGPFAETKEQLLGFFIIDCASLDDAVQAARDLAIANPGTGAYELRPVAIFKPGTTAASATASSI